MHYIINKNGKKIPLSTFDELFVKIHLMKENDIEFQLEIDTDLITLNEYLGILDCFFETRIKITENIKTSKDLDEYIKALIALEEAYEDSD